MTVVKTYVELGEALLKSAFDGNYMTMRELFDQGVTLDYKSKVNTIKWRFNISIYLLA